VPLRIKSYYVYHVDKRTVAIILYQVLTYFKLTNSVNYIAIVIVFGALLKGNINRAMPYALILTAIGCVFDICSVLFRTTDDDGSSWAHVKFFHFIMRIFIILYVLLYTLMLYCYWLHSMAVAQKKQIRLQLGLYDESKK
ncbi:uncharacterized protein LOC132938188, partial [Metopolophium dirhodum]|uniref:uncharacterized protein LOC132938188 n=1 Tax=Metopolophium dirhodum TaxID=44670 RepID=UPI0029904DD9